MNSDSKNFQWFDCLPHGYCVIDADWHFVFWNATLERWSHIERSQILGRKLTEVFEVFKQTRYKTRITQALQSGAPTVFSSLIHKHLMPFPLDNDKHQIHQYYVTGIVTEAGERFAIITVEDVTGTTELLHNYRNICSQLRFEEQQAKDLAKAKEQFFAYMSHEIRTLLNGIIGSASLLQQADLKENDREFVSTIVGSGDALLKIIHSILDYTKLEAGALDIHEESFDLRLLVDEVVLLFAENARRKNILLSNVVDQLIPSRLAGDSLRIRQVLSNLLSNAIKFTEKGEVQLRVSRVSDESGSHLLRFDVVDTGPGIPEHAKVQLFQPFKQLVRDRATGTGLGLAISRNLARLMGGDCGVESSLGHGSVFWFSCRVQWEPVANYPLRPVYDQTQVSILTKDTLLLTRLRDILILRGVQSVEWADSVEALANMTQGLCIITEDFFASLSKLAGQALLKKLRESRTSVLLVGMQVHNAHESETFVSTYQLPLRQASFYRTLELVTAPLFGQTTPSLPAPAHDKDVQQSSLHILVADDNLLNQKVITTMLKRLGHQCDVVSTGRAAVQACQAYDYDLVFMDCWMPDLDGIEATSRIRGFSSVTIIALTANATPDEQQRCFEAGMNDFMSKPIKMDLLSDIVARHLPAKKVAC